MRSTILVLCGLVVAGQAALTGTVKTPSGAGLSGVSVSLRRTAVPAATTGANGQWTIASVGVGEHALKSSEPTGNLILDEGHLEIRFQGVGADGRRVQSSPVQVPQQLLAARSAAVTDTLVFSLGGSVRAMLPIGTMDSLGIVTVIDTSSAAVDEGITTTQWASGCRTTKPTCTAGTWVAGGPSPDRSTAKLIKESAHFAIYSEENISDADATNALNTLETVVWENLFNSNLFMPEPFCNATTKYKPSIHVRTGDGLSAGGWRADRVGMWIGPGGLNDHWGLTHEFTHAWQYWWGFNGGLGCPRSNTCGWIAESHANYTPHQLPEYKNNVHCSEMLTNMPHLALGNARDRYCNWQFMEYLKDKHCPEATNEIWTTDGPDPFTNIQKSRGWTLDQLNDFFGDWAMHNVVWDYKATPGAFRSSYNNITVTDKAERMRRLTKLESLDDSWATNRRFVSPSLWAPQRFGYNVVRLYPDAGASTVTVKFRGINQTGSNAGFRWGLVATNAGFTTARYSKMQKGLDGQLTFKVVSGEPLFLVVTGTPTAFETIVFEQDHNTIWRFPWMVELANAWPQGFQNAQIEACPTGTVRHSNGGGCAPSGTPTTVFVGPYAKILSGGSASGNARIEDHAIVANGKVTGGTVGGLTIVGNTGSQYGNNAFNVSGGTVRTNFYPLGFFEAGQAASGTVNLYGDVEYRGQGLNRSSGNLTGFVDETTSRGSATDKNAKGPWTWRP
jgi:hypothetical protein